MSQERDDYRDLDRPRRLWYGSAGFVLMALSLAGGALVAAAFTFGERTPVGTWVFGFVAIAGPYALIFAATRRAGADGRGRGLIHVCGPVVIVTGCLFLVVALSDARDRVRRGRPPELGGITLAGGPVFFAQWTAGALALLIARPSRSAG